MNREDLAVKLVTDLAKLVVGHPDKLHDNVREFGRATVLILRAVGCDTGRLVGPRGAMVQALKRVGNDIALDGFDLMINEPMTNAPVIALKPWAEKPAKSVLEGIVAAVFNGSATVKWQAAGNTDLVEVVVCSGFDGDLIERLNNDLAMIFHAIGRAHNRNIRLNVREATRA